MPDAVETYAGPVPWWLHSSPTAKSAVILDGTRRGREIAADAGIDWPVSKRPLSFPASGYAAGVRMVDAGDYMAMSRDTDDAFFGIVKKTYHVYQNIDAIDMMDSLLDATRAGGDEVQYETAGSLFGGAQCWAQARIDKQYWIRGDGSPLDDYLLGWWGHDGRHGLGYANTLVRTVCKNTLDAARAGASNMIVIRHTSNMIERIGEARRVLDLHAKYVDKMLVDLDNLTRRPMTLEDVKAFTVALIPSNPEVEHPTRTEAERDAILSIFKSSDLLDGLGLTAYRTYNAVTEYLDHHKDVRTTKAGGAVDRAAVSIVEGSAYDIKTKALSLLLKA